MKKSMNKKQGIDPCYGKINWASVSQQPLINGEDCINGSTKDDVLNDDEYLILEFMNGIRTNDQPNVDQIINFVIGLEKSISAENDEWNHFAALGIGLNRNQKPPNRI